MSWNYEFSDDAIRDLRDIGPSAAKCVTDFLDKRVRGCANPRAFGRELHGSKRGIWRYRVQDYRILCQIHDERLIVMVVQAGHRKEVYG